MTLNQYQARSHNILEAIILSYADSALPVGSEYLTQHYSFGVSSATIRNVMAELESQGLVTHPHTSAGRIPTDLGYRYYVDVLMRPKNLTPEEERRIDELSHVRVDNPFELLEEAASLLADLTGEAGVALVPQLAHGSFRHLELIRMDERELVGVLITSEGLIKHALLELQQPLAEEELARIKQFLNQELVGMPLAQVYSYLRESLQEATNLLPIENLLQEEVSVILEGTSRIFSAPEFQDAGRTRQLLDALENRHDLADILRRDLAADKVKLHIGSENKGTHLTACTIAAAPYRLRGGVMGTLGVLGPTRMNYPRVAGLVKRMSQDLTRAFEEI